MLLFNMNRRHTILTLMILLILLHAIGFERTRALASDQTSRQSNGQDVEALALPPTRRPSLTPSLTPSHTPAPPTNTPVRPTNTPVDTPDDTNTPIPPTDTPDPGHTSTPTIAPATATQSPIPSATSAATLTMTPTPPIITPSPEKTTTSTPTAAALPPPTSTPAAGGGTTPAPSQPTGEPPQVEAVLPGAETDSSVPLASTKEEAAVAQDEASNTSSARTWPNINMLLFLAIAALVVAFGLLFYLFRKKPS